jgi:hypothetical protein
MKHLDTTSKLFAPAKAEQLAAELQRGEDDGWSYTAVHDPKGTGYSFIEITDEDGVFVARY